MSFQSRAIRTRIDPFLISAGTIRFEPETSGAAAAGLPSAIAGEIRSQAERRIDLRLFAHRSARATGSGGPDTAGRIGKGFDKTPRKRGRVLGGRG